MHGIIYCFGKTKQNSLKPTMLLFLPSASLKVKFLNIFKNYLYLKIL
jgi:hypothetical protein